MIHTQDWKGHLALRRMDLLRLLNFIIFTEIHIFPTLTPEFTASAPVCPPWGFIGVPGLGF
jgi:hypothetical protein